MQSLNNTLKHSDSIWKFFIFLYTKMCKSLCSVYCNMVHILECYAWDYCISGMYPPSCIWKGSQHFRNWICSCSQLKGWGGTFDWIYSRCISTLSSKFGNRLSSENMFSFECKAIYKVNDPRNSPCNIFWTPSLLYCHGSMMHSHIHRLSVYYCTAFYCLHTIWIPHLNCIRIKLIHWHKLDMIQ
jgi:hypothetical protein